MKDLLFDGFIMMASMLKLRVEKNSEVEIIERFTVEVVRWWFGVKLWFRSGSAVGFWVDRWVESCYVDGDGFMRVMRGVEWSPMVGLEEEEGLV